MYLDLEDEDLEKSFKDLLQFYGTQLQSHASVIIGLAVVIFAIFQVWGQLVSGSSSTAVRGQTSQITDLHRWLFSGFVGVLGFLVVYEVFRLIIFGKLSSALSYCKGPEFLFYKNDYKRRVAEFNSKKLHTGESSLIEWCDLSNFEKINVYLAGLMRSGLKPFLVTGLFTIKDSDNVPRVVRSFWILSLGFALSFAFSFNFIFSNFDLASLLEQLFGGFLFLEVAHFLLRLVTL